MIAVTYHADLNEVQGDARLGALLGEEAAAPFDRLAWWRLLAQECGVAPCLAVARSGADVAVLPLARAADGLVGLANWYTFRLKPVVSAGADRAALLAALARDLPRRCGRITLTHVPDENGEADALVDAFTRAGWWVRREVDDTNHILQVGGRCFAEYLAARPGALRTTLKRKAKKVDVVLLDAFDPAAFADYEAIYADSWKPEEGAMAFWRRFTEQEGAAGRLRMALAYAEGRAVAAQIWTVEGGCAFIHKLAYREEAKPLSAGTTLTAALFERVIDRDRVEWADFGTGDDGYKRDWMEAQRARYRLEMIRPGQPAQWPRLLRAGAKALAKRLVGAIRRV